MFRPLLKRSPWLPVPALVFRGLCSGSFKEIRIPVPWGHIAGKEWGRSGGRPLLGIHGWQDNCGTFDLLAPLLPEDLHFVAMDLPGHGLSSHLPPGFFYDMVSYVGYVRRVVKHLDWADLDILAHSMGASVGFGYASCFPSSVRKMAVLDLVQPFTMPTSILPSFLARRIDQLIESDRTAVSETASPPRTYALDELVSKLLESTEDFMTEASARVLLKRGCRPVGDGSRVALTRDTKLRISLPVASEEQLTVFRESLRCELLVILASNGIRRMYPEGLVRDVLGCYRKRAKSFRLVDVEGTHHVHLNNPERVLPVLKDFFSS